MLVLSANKKREALYVTEEEATNEKCWIEFFRLLYANFALSVRVKKILRKTTNRLYLADSKRKSALGFECEHRSISRKLD